MTEGVVLLPSRVAERLHEISTLYQASLGSSDRLREVMDSSLIVSSSALVSLTASSSASCKVFVDRKRLRCSMRDAARDLTAAHRDGLVTVYSEEHAEWGALLTYWLQVLEWVSRVQVDNEWGYFIRFAETNEPQWRQAATNATHARIVLEADQRVLMFAKRRLDVEDQVVLEKEAHFQEARDWLMAQKFSEEDERAMVQRAQARARSNFAATCPPASVTSRPSSSQQPAGYPSYNAPSYPQQQQQPYLPYGSAPQQPMGYPPSGYGNVSYPPYPSPYATAAGSAPGYPYSQQPTYPQQNSYGGVGYPPTPAQQQQQQPPFYGGYPGQQPQQYGAPPSIQPRR